MFPSSLCSVRPHSKRIGDVHNRGGRGWAGRVSLFSGWARLLIWVGLLLPSMALAQNRLNRYQPNSPTVSPYLNLTRNSSSGLPNYYALVRPQLQQNADARSLQGLLRQDRFRQRANPLGTTEQLDVYDPVPAALPTGSRSQFQTYGTHPYFRDYYHFYPAAPPVPSRRR